MRSPTGSIWVILENQRTCSIFVIIQDISHDLLENFFKIRSFILTHPFLRFTGAAHLRNKKRGCLTDRYIVKEVHQRTHQLKIWDKTRHTTSSTYKYRLVKVMWHPQWNSVNGDILWKSLHLTIPYPCPYPFPYPYLLPFLIPSSENRWQKIQFFFLDNKELWKLQ